MFRLILGLCLLVVVIAKERPKREKLSPDDRLKICCNRRYREGKVLKSCLGYCRKGYDVIDPMVLIGAVTDPQCDGESLLQMLRCAARDHDHSRCCSRIGVPSDCLQYCRPAHDTLSADLKYAHCAMNHLRKVKYCFMKYERANPKYGSVRSSEIKS